MLHTLPLRAEGWCERHLQLAGELTCRIGTITRDAERVNARYGVSLRLVRRAFHCPGEALNRARAASRAPIANSAGQYVRLEPPAGGGLDGGSRGLVRLVAMRTPRPMRTMAPTTIH